MDTNRNEFTNTGMELVKGCTCAVLVSSGFEFAGFLVEELLEEKYTPLLINVLVECYSCDHYCYCFIMSLLLAC